MLSLHQSLILLLIMTWCYLAHPSMCDRIIVIHSDRPYRSLSPFELEVCLICYSSLIVQ